MYINLLLLCALTFLCRCFAVKELVYHHVGCYGDRKDKRSLPEYHGHHSSKGCAQVAHNKGYKVFGLQNGGECWTGTAAYGSYDMYGESTNCKNGKGGICANDVYSIVGYKDPCPNMEGLLPDKAIKTCRYLKHSNPKATSGIYWINPTGSHAFQAYCDMDTAGGGWTLVFSYTFTNYGSFRSGINSITPQPDWPSVGNIPRSTEPPLSETHYAAMHFNLWKELGSEFMIKSNINHWITCTDGSGSLLYWRTGSIHCQVVKNVGHMCHNYAPDYIKFVSAGSGGKDLGPNLERTSSKSSLKEYYYLEASTKTSNWPTHDPCGTNAVNHVQGVASPRGNIYVR